MKKFAIFAVLTTLVLASHIHPYQIISHGLQEVKSENFDQAYAAYNSLLNKYVLDAKVNYQGFIDSRAEFEAFLSSLGSVDQADFDTWTKEQKLSFWINAYNAFTIKAIIDNYPITRSFSLIGIFYAPSNSILQIKGVWDKLQFRAVGKMVTLEEIEHEILRKEFNEPRIHMAIVCASISCPDLRNKAYMSEKLEEQLRDASINFVNNPYKGVSIDQQDGKVKFSKIFKWFGEDFIQNYGNEKLISNYSLKENAVLNFTAEYIQSDETREYLMNNKLKIGYLGYDWHLSDLQDPNSPPS